MRSAPEHVVAHPRRRKREAGREKENKIAVWSTKGLEETANRQDTKEMVQWRSISEECIDELWKELCGTTEEVSENYNVDRVLIKDVVSVCKKQRARENVANNPHALRRKGAEGEARRVTTTECKRLREELGAGGRFFHGMKELWNIDDVEGKAEEMENMNTETEQGERKSGKRELEEEKGGCGL